MVPVTQSFTFYVDGFYTFCCCPDLSHYKHTVHPSLESSGCVFYLAFIRKSMWKWLTLILAKFRTFNGADTKISYVLWCRNRIPHVILGAGLQSFQQPRVIGSTFLITRVTRYDMKSTSYVFNRNSIGKSTVKKTNNEFVCLCCRRNFGCFMVTGFLTWWQHSRLHGMVFTPFFGRKITLITWRTCFLISVATTLIKRNLTKQHGDTDCVYNRTQKWETEWFTGLTVG